MAAWLTWGSSLRRSWPTAGSSSSLCPLKTTPQDSPQDAEGTLAVTHLRQCWEPFEEWRSFSFGTQLFHWLGLEQSTSCGLTVAWWDTSETFNMEYCSSTWGSRSSTLFIAPLCCTPLRITLRVPDQRWLPSHMANLIKSTSSHARLTHVFPQQMLWLFTCTFLYQCWQLVGYLLGSPNERPGHSLGQSAY